MPFCLPTNLTDIFKRKLVSGEINPGELANMSSANRRAFFAEFLGDFNARKVNAEFESKLLLKNWKRGMITWAKNTAGLTNKARSDIISRIQKMDTMLNPESREAFLEDLAAQKLGVSVTMQEAGNLSALANKVNETKKDMENGGDRMKYGAAVVDFHNYRNGLIGEAKGETKTLREDWDQFKENPVQKGLQVIIKIPAASRAVKAAWDVGFIFRQGIKTIATNPRIWARTSLKALDAAQSALRGKSIMDAVNADIMSRPLAVEGIYQKAKLSIGTREEDIPTSAPEKLPFLIGRLFKASNDAYTAQAHLMRADLFDFYYNRAKENGVDVTDTNWLLSMGAFVGQKTGRARFPGQYEKGADIANQTFFAPRFWAAQIQTFTQPVTGAREGFFSGDFGFSDKGTNMIRKEAAKNLVGLIVLVSIVKTISSILLGDDSTEEDPRSTDYGRIRVGDTRFDITGGHAALVTLAARLATQKTKSSTTGLVSEINSDEFGSRDGWQVTTDYISNKLAPGGSLAKNAINRETFHGQPLTVANTLTGLFVPIPAETAWEAMDNERSADLLAIMILDGLGTGSNTYSINSDWNKSSSKMVNSFKDYIGDKKRFQEINDEYNDKFNDWFTSLKENQDYQSLNDDDKRRALTKKRQEVRDEIFEKYDFEYEREDLTELPDL